MAKLFGFGKNEKLKSRKLIGELFTSGQSYPAWPLRMIYRFVDGGRGHISVGVSVSKRNFKKAVDRNRLKRLMREAYRLQKNELAEAMRPRLEDLNIFFMFNAKEMTDFHTVSAAMKKCLGQLQKQVKNHENLS